MALTTTSYAILGLLDLRDWTAYELTQQARRSLAYIWPVSESQLYAEPKRLQREGLITIKEAPAGNRRTRQHLRITAKGRTALRSWLATTPETPRVQSEALLRTFFAPAGTKADLLAALESTKRSVREAYELGHAMTLGYQAGDNPFPERVHANALWMVFIRDLLVLKLRWIDFAMAEVEKWTDTAAGGDPQRTAAFIDAMVAGESAVVPDLPIT